MDFRDDKFHLVSWVWFLLFVQVRKHFRPELLNRLDEIVVFEPLGHDQLLKVARMQMKDIAQRLAERGVALAVTDAALDLVLSESYDPVSDLLFFLLEIPTSSIQIFRNLHIWIFT